MLKQFKQKLKEKKSKKTYEVNKSGFPMDICSWKRMWSFATEQNRDLIPPKELPDVPMPKPPLKLPKSMTVPNKILQIQNYLSQLDYNYTGTQFFNIQKKVFLTSLMKQAKIIVEESLPIKCLEAVLVAIYLSNNIPELYRLPVSFKSSLPQRTCKHVVLVVHHQGRFGCVGLSRSPNLMYKPLKYESLSDLLLDFVYNYLSEGHRMISIKVGQCVPHDNNSIQTIQWKFRKVKCENKATEQIKKELDKVARDLKKANSFWLHYPNKIKKELSKMKTIKLPLINRSTNKITVCEQQSDNEEPVYKEGILTENLQKKAKTTILPTIQNKKEIETKRLLSVDDGDKKKKNMIHENNNLTNTNNTLVTNSYEKILTVQNSANTESKNTNKRRKNKSKRKKKDKNKNFFT